MSENTKRKLLKGLCDHVREEDLDFAISVMQDFAARYLNEENKKGDSISCSLTPDGCRRNEDFR